MNNKDIAFDLIFILISALGKDGFQVENEIQSLIETKDLTEEQKETIKEVKKCLKSKY